ncbi:MAG: hypothetical protein ACFCBW_14750 [Candidatus Competibacterales bacterium]
MRRRQREINVFSISALDLFASAMGAFILITIVLFPYYLRDANQENLAEALAQAEAQVEALTERLEAQQDQLAVLQRQATKTFLVVVLRWKTRDQDIDLYVSDPDGREFYYRQHNQDGNHYPGVDAFLSVDSRRGPGAEVWFDPVAEAGLYRIRASLYDRVGNPRDPPLEVAVFFRDGNLTLPQHTLRRERDKELIAEISVNARGQVALR